MHPRPSPCSLLCTSGPVWLGPPAPPGLPSPLEGAEGPSPPPAPAAVASEPPCPSPFPAAEPWAEAPTVPLTTASCSGQHTLADTRKGASSAPLDPGSRAQPCPAAEPQAACGAQRTAGGRLRHTWSSPLSTERSQGGQVLGTTVRRPPRPPSQAAGSQSVGHTGRLLGHLPAPGCRRRPWGQPGLGQPPSAAWPWAGQVACARSGSAPASRAHALRAATRLSRLSTHTGASPGCRAPRDATSAHELGTPLPGRTLWAWETPRRQTAGPKPGSGSCNPTDDSSGIAHVLPGKQAPTP